MAFKIDVSKLNTIGPPKPINTKECVTFDSPLSPEKTWLVGTKTPVQLEEIQKTVAYEMSIAMALIEAAAFQVEKFRTLVGGKDRKEWDNFRDSADVITKRNRKIVRQAGVPMDEFEVKNLNSQESIINLLMAANKLNNYETVIEMIELFRANKLKAVDEQPNMFINP
jgi:hypothetical protein